MYYFDIITHNFNSQNIPASAIDLNEWMEAATTPPAGWTARRTNAAVPSTYTMYDPYGHWLTVQLRRYGGTMPSVVIGYAWITLPTAKCARVLDLYQRMGKMHKLFYISSLPGSCSPNATRTMDYYLSSGCCPSSSSGYAAYFQLPYQ